jgi:hypothetical protein
MIELISTGQIQARVNDEKTRMRQAAIAIDFYNGQQYQYMKSVAERIYPSSWQDIEYYLSTCDLTKQVINQKSILFQAPPEIELDTDNEALQERFKQMLDDSNLWKKLIAVDRMAELTGKVGLTLHWHNADKRIVVDILTPDKTIVIADEQDPTQAAIVYFRVGIDTDPRLASAVNVYGKWTLDSYSEVALGDNLQEIKTVTPPIPNPYGKVPVVWFSPDIEVDTFWIDKGYPLIEGNININLRESNLDLALDFQSFSTLVTKGIPNTPDIITGATRRIDLPGGSLGAQSDSNAFYITPDAKLQEVGNRIDAKKISIAKDNGLSADAFNQDSSKISSGYQLRLTQKQIEENNALKKLIYREPLLDYIELMMACYTANSPDFRFPDDVDVYFSYIDRPAIDNPQETVALLIIKINANLMSYADALRVLNPTLSQEEALEEAKRIVAENRQLTSNISPISDIDLGIGS